MEIVGSGPVTGLDRLDLGFGLPVTRRVRYTPAERLDRLLRRRRGCVQDAQEPAVHAGSVYATPKLRAPRGGHRFAEPEVVSRGSARRSALTELIRTVGGRDAAGICAIGWVEQRTPDGIEVALIGTPVRDRIPDPTTGLFTCHLSEPDLRRALALGVRPRSVLLVEATASEHLPATGTDTGLSQERAEQVLARAMDAARAETERARTGCGGAFVLVGPVGTDLRRVACAGPVGQRMAGVDLRATVTVLATALSGRPVGTPRHDPLTVLPLSGLAAQVAR